MTQQSQAGTHKQPDLESFYAHDENFKTGFDTSWHKKMYVEAGIYDQFETVGYKALLEMFPQVRGVHVDIGSGGGWLVNMTAPLFRRVVGIEPSHAGIETARDITKSFSNIEFIEADMVAGLPKAAVTEPAFVTTATVLSHIEDRWVTELLGLVNELPGGSILLFGEAYNSNIHRKLWHVRHISWWAERLPDWQLLPIRRGRTGRRYGIAGVRVGKANVLNTYGLNSLTGAVWAFEGWLYKLRNFFADLKKHLG